MLRPQYRRALALGFDEAARAAGVPFRQRGVSVNGSPPPPPDSGYYLAAIDHLWSVVAGIAGAIVAAFMFVWRMGTWTERTRLLIEGNRAASDARHEETERASDMRHQIILAQLEAMRQANDDQHNTAQRDIGRVITTAEALSRRIDRIMEGRPL